MNRLVLILTVVFAMICLVFYQQSRKVLFFGFALEGDPITYQQFDEVVEKTGLIPSILMFYLQFPPKEAHFEFPHTTFSTIAKYGAIPCLSWEPMTIIGEKESIITVEEIMSGTYDSYITLFAREAKQFQKPLIIRLAHEMNLSRYHWGVPESEYEKGAESYKQLFRYIVSIFRKEKADNVFFVFCPNVVSIPNQSWNDVHRYYPGDEYVDIFGMDGYNWQQDPRAAYQTFEEVFAELYYSLKKLNPSLPLFVFETSACIHKAKWLEDAIDTAIKWHIQGIIWFQVAKEHDWRLAEHEIEKHAFARPFKASQWLEKLQKQRQKSS